MASMMKHKNELHTEMERVSAAFEPINKKFETSLGAGAEMFGGAMGEEFGEAMGGSPFAMGR